VTFGMVQ